MEWILVLDTYAGRELSGADHFSGVWRDQWGYRFERFWPTQVDVAAVRIGERFHIEEIKRAVRSRARAMIDDPCLSGHMPEGELRITATIHPEPTITDGTCTPYRRFQDFLLDWKTDTEGLPLVSIAVHSDCDLAVINPFIRHRRLSYIEETPPFDKKPAAKVVLSLLKPNTEFPAAADRFFQLAHLRAIGVERSYLTALSSLKELVKNRGLDHDSSVEQARECAIQLLKGLDGTNHALTLELRALETIQDRGQFEEHIKQVLMHLEQ